ncbi:fatty acid desaturase [Pseudogracilibacillus auburnensis]|uniref:fatty acid desaturase n=1 Tax=Pseudogracilibacillus auburnensis TaxID=1494959 RepID=UPI001A976E45|nr:fatty acid desaturase [Pseudogracilibacillus auburnensis]MBO1002823.1 fatty acid desaturase [Pseudogracilibacillus auburnensis]
MSKEKTVQLHKSVAPFTHANNRKSIIQIINTIPPVFLCWFFAFQSLSISIWLAFVFSILASGFVVRTFIIFHDCTHGSFFHHKKTNDFLGTLTGVITLFPYEKWKREHAIHHASSSNLDKRGIGDIWVMTIDEYVKATKWQRLMYRLYRNPFIMFGLGPLYLILVSNRMNRKNVRKKERNNTYVTNVLIILFYGLIFFIVGWKAFLIVQGVTLYVAAALGIWLFYIQHTFEDSYFEEESEWNYVKAAVEGSSYYELPRVLQWLTGNIGYHHVHHLAPRVPNYHLEEAHETTPPLQYATKITLITSLDSLRYRLYNPMTKSFVTFREANQYIQGTKREKLTKLSSQSK